MGYSESSSAPKPTTGTLPKKILILLIPICIFHDMDITMVFSFTPRMIKSFGTSEVQTGYYAGLLGSSMYIGMILCSLPWSHLGDTKGKKLSLVISSSFLTVSIFAFGFSRTFVWAFVTRLLQGCSFGAVNVSKSILREYLDDSNMALGMSVITLTGTIGLIIGPAFAGVTVFPVEQYPTLFGGASFLREFPVFIPGAIISVCLVVSIVFVAAHMPEHQDGSECVRLLQDETSTSSEDQPMSERIDKGAKETTKFPASNPTPSPTKNSLSDWKLMQIFKRRDCIVSCILYGFLGFSSTAFNELFPLLASTSLQYHGMALSTSQIGVILLISAGILLVVQIPLLTKVTDFLGPRSTFFWSAVLQGVLIPFLPAIAEVSNKTCLWVLLCAHVLLIRLFVQASFLTVTVLMNNTATSDLSATVNGLGFTFAALGRILSPLVFGTLYSWSLENMKTLDKHDVMTGFPFNQYFPFLVWSVVSFIMACVGRMLSSNADKKSDSL